MAKTNSGAQLERDRDNLFGGPVETKSAGSDGKNSEKKEKEKGKR
jgi:hypothetical protein